MANLSEEQRIHIYLQESRKGLMQAGAEKMAAGYEPNLVQFEMETAYEICLRRAFPINYREKRRKLKG